MLEHGPDGLVVFAFCPGADWPVEILLDHIFEASVLHPLLIATYPGKRPTGRRGAFAYEVRPAVKCAMGIWVRRSGKLKGVGRVLQLEIPS